MVTTDLSISIDGFAAGPRQSAEKPFGDGKVDALIRWMFEDGEASAAELAGIGGAGSYIMGRNMFGPDRGSFDLSWTGWWGDTPPYGAPVFVLSHHERESFELAGGTSFTFVNGIRPAFDLAVAAAQAAGSDRVAIAGGATTVNQFLAAGLIDELRLHISPVVLGSGERLFDRVPSVDLEQVSSRATSLVTHQVYRVLR
ncbi:dihydrofolate reductase [Nakamurella sp. YIM 132087]|uniref:Dihydrofolate reductase n=2 Tax=Nakamurella alba TaxID=2665158 RepID=A0A7K1FL29_9ACTN|nr:dihydrofolate reductase [Nakamurella alba]